MTTLNNRFELTPHGQISPGLQKLLTAMEAIGTPFNAALTPAGPDVSTLALVDNGVGWEAVCEVAVIGKEAKYDLWYHGRMAHTNLELEQAAQFLVARYVEGKYARVLARLHVTREGVH